MNNPYLRILSALTLLGFLLYPLVSFGNETTQKWQLINPESVIKIEPMKVNPHPSSLAGKTVILRANGKHNADHFLDRVAELLEKQVKDIKIIKTHGVAPETNITSQNPARSERFAQKIASFKPDLVIGSQCD